MKMICILVIIFGFSQCGSLQLENNPPFTISSATVTDWVGGQPGNSGKIIKISYTTDKTIVFDSIYYQNKIVKIAIKNSPLNKMIVGNFKKSINKQDLILHSNAKKESNNKIPSIKKFPFKLEDNQAIISFKIEGKTKYFKVNNITEAKRIAFPSAPKK